MKVEGLEPGVIIRAQKDRIRDLEMETISLRQVVERLKNRRPGRLPPRRGTRLHPLRERAGMTLVEVLMALAIFMLGAVGIIGLFATATRLHYDAGQRRIASFVLDSTLAEVQKQPLAAYYAETKLIADATAGSSTLDVDSTFPYVDVVLDQDNPQAQFQRWPWWTQDFTDSRRTGMLIVGGEWIWSDGLSAHEFNTLTRGLWGPPGGHPAGSKVRQVREWVLAYRDMPTRFRLECLGRPTDLPIPAQGYLEVEGTWMEYSGFDDTGFDIVAQPDVRGLVLLPGGQMASTDTRDGLPDRSVGGTPEPLPNPNPAGGALRPVAVNVARPVDGYDHCWGVTSLMPTTNYTVGTRVRMSVGMEQAGRLRNVWATEFVYFPEHYSY